MWSSLPDNPRRRTLVLGLFLLTLGTCALSLPSFGRMDLRGVGIFDVEMMRTTSKATALLAELGPGGVDATQTSIYLDYAFLVLYGLALSASCIVLATALASRGSMTLASLGRRAAAVAVIAAACDAVENVALLVVLGDHPGQPWPALATGLASAKFALLALVIVFLVVGLIAVALGGGRSAQPAGSDG